MSKQIAKRICQPFSVDCLDNVQTAVHALKSPILERIPVLEDTSGIQDVFVKSANLTTATFFVERFKAFEIRCNHLRVDISKRSVFVCITEITGLMWKYLIDFIDLPNLFEAKYNQKDPTDTTERNHRPDEVAYVDNFIVSKSEHKAENIDEAVSELTSKLADYNIVEYGVRIKVLPVIAAAGIFVEVGCVDVRTRTYHKVNRFRTDHPRQRALIFLSMINVLRMIHTMTPFIPSNVTPLFKEVKGIIYAVDHVVKRKTISDTCPPELYTILSRGEVPNAVRVEISKDGNKLKIFPKGVRIVDNALGLNETEVRSALRAILPCLAYIHSHGFVHRDIRWPNIIQEIKYAHGNEESVRYVVIDFEFAAKIGDLMEINNYIHERIVGFGQYYFARHDLKLVAKLVRTWATSNNVTLSSDANDFVDSLSSDVKHLAATEALQHPWLHE